MTDIINKKVIVAQTEHRKRLDAFIASQCPEINRNRSKKLILKGNVYINQKICTEPDKILNHNAIVEINIPQLEDTHIKPEEIPLDIIFEDENLLVINKPSNMITHPAGAKQTGTVVNAVLHHCKGKLSGINGVAKPGIIHRLDKDTSGILMIAKNDKTHNKIANQMNHTKKHLATKIYCAALWGQTPEKYGEIIKPLAKAKNDPRKQVIAEYGKYAATKYYTIAQCKDQNDKVVATAILAKIITGRTHQIRAHTRSIRCPVINDKIYAADFNNKINALKIDTRKILQKLERHMLHANLIRIIMNGKPISFVANMPRDLAIVMKEIFGENIEKIITDKADFIARQNEQE